MLSIQSRIKFASTGPDAFGAKTSAAIETDFLGISQNDVRQLRIRNAFLKLDWGTTNLLLGQYWHPTIYTKAIPGVIHFGAAAPFHPLHRSSQARITFNPSENLELLAAALIHGYHISSGSAEAQRNAGLPDFQFRGIFKTDIFYFGANAGYKFLTPRLETATNLKTTKTVGSYNTHLFAGADIDPIHVSGGLIYGQNLTHFVMIGGYASSDVNDDYDYTNFKTMSIYADAYLKMDNLLFGGFAGYSKNLGADDDIMGPVIYGRALDASYIFRIAPRVVVVSGKTSFAFEYNLTGAAYGTAFDAKGKATDTDDIVVNNKLLFLAKYTF